MISAGASVASVQKKACGTRAARGIADQHPSRIGGGGVARR
jgi:hypothetical protein